MNRMDGHKSQKSKLWAYQFADGKHLSHSAQGEFGLGSKLKLNIHTTVDLPSRASSKSRVSVAHLSEMLLGSQFEDPY